MIELKFQFETTNELVEFVSCLSADGKAKIVEPKKQVALADGATDKPETLADVAADKPEVTDKTIDAQRSALRALVSSKTTAGFKDEVRAILDACENAPNVTKLDPKYFASVTEKVIALG